MRPVPVTRYIRSADGVTVGFEEAGPSDARPVVFVHGIAQSRDVWSPVLTGPLAKDMRLVTLDLRGHGDSDKPDDAEAYTAGHRLGCDLQAVIEHLQLRRPLVVAWSYGGVIVGEHLRHRGGAELGGILLVAAAVQVGRAAKQFFGPTMMDNAKALLSDDKPTYEAGSRAFLDGCAAAPLDATFREHSLAAMLRVPTYVRRALLTRSEDYSAELSRCEAPVATVHGALDSVVLPLMSEHVLSTVPGSEGSVLEGVGHLPWLEAPGAFTTSVRALAARAH